MVSLALDDPELFFYLSMDSSLKILHYLSSEKFSEFPLHIILMGSELAQSNNKKVVGK